MSSDALLNQTSSLPVSEEHDLVARIRARDPQACETMVRRFGGRMMATARRFFVGVDDCADAVQDAFLSAFRAIDRFEGTASLGTWLHRIVVNACLMKLRSRGADRSIPLDDLLPSFDATGHHTRSVKSWSEEAGVGLDRAETRALVRERIDQLPEAYRTIILLRDIEEMDTEATARRLGISPGAVKTRLHRARQALRTLLEPGFCGTGIQS